jgi:hypothetical protein
MLPRSTNCVGTLPSCWVMGRPNGLLRRILPVLSCCCVFLATCSNQPSGPEPPTSVTLLVTNATCSSGQCSSFQVRGFPSNLPPVPAGNRSLDLGTVSTEYACLSVPPADTFWTGQTPSVWTSNDSLSLGILYPGEGWPEAKGSTKKFVPARSTGWRVTLPGDTAVTPANGCG